MRPKEHRQIVRAVLEKEEKEREQEIASMMPRLRSLVDDATYPDIPDSCFRCQFSIYIDVLDEFIHHFCVN